MLDISHALAADLDDLADAMDIPDATRDALIEAVQTFHRDVGLAVRSFLGLTITLEIHGEAASFTILDDELTADDIGSTLRLPLHALGLATSPRTTTVLYAERPGAFVDLAADLTYALGLAPDELVVDGDAPPGQRSDLAGLEHLAVIDRAVGVLMARGHTLQGARDMLQSMPRAHISLWSAAHDFLAVL